MRMALLGCVTVSLRRSIIFVLLTKIQVPVDLGIIIYESNISLALLVCFIVAPFVGALATFYTGFGLNTILVPVFMIYWDAPMAVLMAGLVHLSNNILKVALTARSIDWHLFRNFGALAILFAFLGAFLLNQISAATSIYLKPIFGAIFICFALLELFNWQLSLRGPWSMRFGGMLSGFFGGFSGHQGALRAMFLSKLKLEPLVFVATTALISLLIDITRIGVYLSDQNIIHYDVTYLMFLVIPSALAGTIIGRKYIKKIKHEKLSMLVGAALLFMGLAMLLGWI